MGAGRPAGSCWWAQAAGAAAACCLEERRPASSTSLPITASLLPHRRAHTQNPSTQPNTVSSRGITAVCALPIHCWTANACRGQASSGRCGAGRQIRCPAAPCRPTCIRHSAALATTVLLPKIPRCTFPLMRFPHTALPLPLMNNERFEAKLPGHLLVCSTYSSPACAAQRAAALQTNRPPARSSALPSRSFSPCFPASIFPHPLACLHSMESSAPARKPAGRCLSPLPLHHRLCPAALSPVS